MIGAGPEAPLRHQLSHSLPDSAQAHADDDRARCPVHFVRRGLVDDAYRRVRCLLLLRYSLNTEGHPLYTNMIPVRGLTCAALTDWAKAALAPGSPVLSDGFGGFTGVTAAGCDHPAILIGLRKPHQVSEFGWLNTILGNLKTRFSGTDHAFNFAKYGTRYLAAFAYQVNRRFHLDTLPAHLLVAAAAIGPRPTCWLRQAEESC